MDEREEARREESLRDGIGVGLIIAFWFLMIQLAMRAYGVIAGVI